MTLDELLSQKVRRLHDTMQDRLLMRVDGDFFLVLDSEANHPVRSERWTVPVVILALDVVGQPVQATAEQIRDIEKDAGRRLAGLEAA